MSKLFEVSYANSSHLQIPIGFTLPLSKNQIELVKELLNNRLDQSKAYKIQSSNQIKDSVQKLQELGNLIVSQADDIISVCKNLLSKNGEYDNTDIPHINNILNTRLSFRSLYQIAEAFKNILPKTKFIEEHKTSTNKLLLELGKSCKSKFSVVNENLFSFLSSKFCSNSHKIIEKDGKCAHSIISRENPLDSLTENLLSKSINTLIIENFERIEVCKIIMHLCRESLELSIYYLRKLIIRLLIHKKKTDQSYRIYYLKIIEDLLLIDDSVKESRIEKFLICGGLVNQFTTDVTLKFFEIVYIIQHEYTELVVDIIIWWKKMMQKDYIKQATESHIRLFEGISKINLDRINPEEKNYLRYLNRKLIPEFNEAIMIIEKLVISHRSNDEWLYVKNFKEGPVIVDKNKEIFHNSNRERLNLSNSREHHISEVEMSFNDNYFFRYIWPFELFSTIINLTTFS